MLKELKEYQEMLDAEKLKTCRVKLTTPEGTFSLNTIPSDVTFSWSPATTDTTLINHTTTNRNTYDYFAMPIWSTATASQTLTISSTSVDNERLREAFGFTRPTTASIALTEVSANE